MSMLEGRLGHCQMLVRSTVEAWRKSPTAGCVLWPFSTTPDGYGHVVHEGRPSLAHRVVLCLTVGPPPSPLHEAAHSCHQPSCFNPAHVRWATHLENMADSERAGRRARGSRMGQAKLTDEKVREARRRHEAGERVFQLVPEFGVTEQSLTKALRRETWRHVL